MPRYIDADEAIQLSKEDKLAWVYDLTDLEEFLSGVPTADVVEVVRCKECKHHRDLDGGVKCERLDGLLMNLPDDFCSYGEKKE